jgi:hypothetical protein
MAVANCRDAAVSGGVPSAVPPQHEAVVAPLQPRQPAFALCGGQPVEDGHGTGDVAFDAGHHQLAHRHAALVADGRERQQLRNGQPHDDDQRDAREQRARHQPAQARAGGGRGRGRAGRKVHGKAGGCRHGLVYSPGPVAPRTRLYCSV